MRQEFSPDEKKLPQIFNIWNGIREGIEIWAVHFHGIDAASHQKNMGEDLIGGGLPHDQEEVDYCGPQKEEIKLAEHPRDVYEEDPDFWLRRASEKTALGSRIFKKWLFRTAVRS